jgi:hypothetical protein
MPELGPYGSMRGARGNSRPYRDQRSTLARDDLSAFDPTATLASISCCSGEADFSPYQSSRLSLYHGVV